MSRFGASRRGGAGAAVAAVAMGALMACGAAPHTRAAGAVAPMTVREVAWEASDAPIGNVRAMADAGKVVVVFGDAVARVVVSGAVVANVPTTAQWVGACALRGVEGDTTWIVGIDRAGRLHHLRALGSFEDVSVRYGVGGRRVLGCATLDQEHTGFLLDGEVAIAARGRSALYGDPDPTPWTSLVGGGGWGAGVASDRVTLFDAETRASRTFTLPGVTGAAVGGDGRLYASTSRALYAARPNGDLALLYDAEGKTLHGLTASGGRVWFADGSELGAIEGDHVAETRGARLPPDASLSPSPSGDVWVVGGGRGPGVRRFARAETELPSAASWEATIGPIFARSCTPCHLATGVSGTDLSTADAWQRERARIDERVVRRHSMPPEGHPLSDADRDAIRVWAEALR